MGGGVAGRPWARGGHRSCAGGLAGYISDQSCAIKARECGTTLSA